MKMNFTWQLRLSTPSTMNLKRNLDPRVQFIDKRSTGDSKSESWFIGAYKFKLIQFLYSFITEFRNEGKPSILAFVSIEGLLQPLYIFNFLRKPGSPNITFIVLIPLDIPFIYPKNRPKYHPFPPLLSNYRANDDVIFLS